MAKKSLNTNFAVDFFLKLMLKTTEDAEDDDSYADEVIATQPGCHKN